MDALSGVRKRDASTRLPQPGEFWVSRDPRDEGLLVSVLEVVGGHVTYRRVNVRRVTVERFVKSYRRPTVAES